MIETEIKQLISSATNAENSKEERIRSLDLMRVELSNGSKLVTFYNSVSITLQQLLNDPVDEVKQLAWELMPILGALKPRKFLDWIFNKISEAQTQENYFALFLPLLIETENRVPVQYVDNSDTILQMNKNTLECIELDYVTAMLMQKIQSYLETMNEHYMLEHLLKLLDYMASPYKDKVQPHFVDIVDILIAWALDPDIPHYLRNTIFSAFKSWKLLWADNTVFSTGLLSKLVQDIEGLSCSHNIDLDRLCYLLCCFISVSIHSPQLVTVSYTCKPTQAPLLQIILNCLHHCPIEFFYKNSSTRYWKTLFFELLFASGIEFLSFYTAFLQCFFRPVLLSKFTYLEVSSLLEDHLDLLKNIVSKENTRRKKDFKILLNFFTMEDENTIKKRNFHFLLLFQNRKVHKKLTETFFFFANHFPSSTFKILSRDLLEILRCSFFSNNSSSLLSWSECQSNSLILCHCMLLCQAKENFADLPLLEIFSACVSIISNKKPSDATLKTTNVMEFVMFESMVRVFHHIREPSMIMKELMLKTACTVNSSSKKLNLLCCELIETILLERDKYFLSCSCSSSSISCACFSFIVPPDLILANLLQLTADLDHQVRSKAVRCLGILMSSFGLSLVSKREENTIQLMNLSQKVILQSLNLVCDVSDLVFTSVLNLLGSLGLGSDWKCCFYDEDKTFISSYSPFFGSCPSLLLKNLYQHPSLWSTFTLFDFAQVMQLLLPQNNESSASTNTEIISPSLLEIFSRCFRIDPEDPRSRWIQNNRVVMLCWLTWEAAKYCVDNKLKSGFGGASQTFATFEKILVSHLNCNTPNLNRLRIFLEFLDALERFLYNAFEGSIGNSDIRTSVIPFTIRSCSSSSKIFFRTNRKVCEDWFERMRPRILEASIKCGSLAFQVRSASLYAVDLQRQMTRLASSHQSPASSNAETSSSSWINLFQTETSSLTIEMQKLYMELDQVLMQLCEALCNLRECDAIRGFISWSSNLVNQIQSKVPLGLVFKTSSSSNKPKNYRNPWMLAVLLESQGRYEDAIQEYKKIFSPIFQQRQQVVLSGTNINSLELLLQVSMSPKSLQQVIFRCCRCYCVLGDFLSLDYFVEEVQYLQTQCRQQLEQVKQKSALQEEKDMKASRDSNLSGQKKEILLTSNISWMAMMVDALTVPEDLVQCDFIRCLSEFPNSIMQGHQFKPTDCSSKIFAAAECIKKSEQLILNAFYNSADSPSHQMNAALEILKEPLLIACLDAESPHSLEPFFCQLQCIQALTTQTPEAALPSLFIASHENSSSPRLKFKLNPMHHDGSLWCKLIGVYDYLSDKYPKGQDEKTKQVSVILKRQCWTLARKQGNLSLSQRLLGKFTTTHGIQSNIASLNYLCCYENARLLHAAGDVTQAILQMWQLASQLMDLKHLKHGDDVCIASNYLSADLNSFHAIKKDGQEIALKVLLRLSQWMRPDIYSLDRKQLEQVKMLNVNSNLDEFENFSGQCLRYAAAEFPFSSKAWLQYSNWCYQQSNKQSQEKFGLHQLNEIKNILLSAKIGESIGYTQQVYDEFKTANVLAEEVLQVFQSFQDEITVQEISSLEKQLKSTFSSSSIACSAIDKLCDLYNKTRLSFLHFHHLACLGYLRFLTISDSGLKEHSHILVTLRLLRFLVKCGPDLQELLQKGFKETPTKPWKYILPQLLARMRHPNVFVSQTVHDLVLRFVETNPSLLIYSTVVTCSQENSEENKHFLSLNQSLIRKHPALMSQVSCFTKELKRISVLWDEQWVSFLSQQEHDIQKRLRALKKEADRVAKNETLSKSEKDKIAKEKYAAMMKPLILAVEKMWRQTGSGGSGNSAETPYELNFLRRYGALIKRAVDSCRFPSDPTDPGAAWILLSELSSRLSEDFASRNCFLLREISPKLADSRNTLPNLQMPGQEDLNNEIELGKVEQEDTKTIVLLESFGENVYILRTKTKPKKMEFVGSDGQKYGYLLKGREDLHLDERVMQLLTIVQRLLDRDAQSSGRNLQVKPYKVIPLSSKAGLIQLVPRVVSIFQVYKNWQDRHPPSSSLKEDQQLQLIQKHESPTSLFYSKLIPLLKAQGVEVAASRKDWPLSVLKKVFKELSASSPRWVLEKELWLSSSGVSEWLKKSSCYGRSLAVMSIVGYVLGLGDRHLDNLLIDFSTGQIVHIDYNVCFDKGKRLQVPEIVPFRLTAILQAALGVTGTQGIYRTASENTLRVMRREKETLLALLEAFVYDPLVDWTLDHAEDQVKRKMERNVSLALFCSRAEEIRVELRRILDNFSSGITRLLSAITRINEERVKIDILAQEQNDLLKEFNQLFKQKAEVLTPPSELKEAEALVQNEENIDRHIEQCRQQLVLYSMDCKKKKEQYVSVVRRLLQDESQDRIDVEKLQNLSSTLPSVLKSFYLLAAKQKEAQTTQKRAHNLPFLNEEQVSLIETRCIAFDQAIERFVDQEKLLKKEISHIFSICEKELFSLLKNENRKEVLDHWGVHQEWTLLIHQILHPQRQFNSSREKKERIEFMRKHLRKLLLRLSVESTQENYIEAVNDITKSREDLEQCSIQLNSVKTFVQPYGNYSSTSCSCDICSNSTFISISNKLGNHFSDICLNFLIENERENALEDDNLSFIKTFFFGSPIEQQIDKVNITFNIFYKEKNTSSVPSLTFFTFLGELLTYFKTCKDKVNSAILSRNLDVESNECLLDRLKDIEMLIKQQNLPQLASKTINDSNATIQMIVNVIETEQYSYIERWKKCHYLLRTFFNELLEHRIIPYLKELLEASSSKSNNFLKGIENNIVMCCQFIEKKKMHRDELDVRIKGYALIEQLELLRHKLFANLKSLEWMGYGSLSNKECSEDNALIQQLSNILLRISDFCTIRSSLEIEGEAVKKEVLSLTRGMQAATRELAFDLLQEHENNSLLIMEYITAVKQSIEYSTSTIEMLLLFCQSGEDRKGRNTPYSVIKLIDQQGVSLLLNYDTALSSLELNISEQKALHMKQKRLQLQKEQDIKQIETLESQLEIKKIDLEKARKNFSKYHETIEESEKILIENVVKVLAEYKKGSMQQVECLVGTLTKITAAKSISKVTSSSSTAPSVRGGNKNLKSKRGEDRMDEIDSELVDNASNSHLWDGKMRHLHTACNDYIGEHEAFYTKLNDLMMILLPEVDPNQQAEDDASAALLALHGVPTRNLRHKKRSEEQITTLKTKLEELFVLCQRLDQLFFTLAEDASYLVTKEEDEETLQEDDTEVETVEVLDADKLDNEGIDKISKTARGQERNLYAVRVLKKVKEKLDGICKNQHPKNSIKYPTLRLTVEEQTDWLLQQATSIDNLCVMYEGWTPWI